jgi:hypothetical protein
MVARVLVGNRTGGTGGGYGLYVSKANSDVTSCADKDLLFTSNERAGASGLVYGGGSQSSLSGSLNFLTTGSKDNLGYIPLVIAQEKRNSTWNWGNQSLNSGDLTINNYCNQISLFSFTSSTITPSKVIAYPFDNKGVYDSRRTSVSDYGGGTGGSHACTNLDFVVLKIPCGYGQMTSTYFKNIVNY